MLHQFSRNELAIGQEGLETLKGKTVAILGVGGVGSFAAEALARSGVGRIVLVDKDDIDITNVNRQIHALISTVGQSKVEAMGKRLLDINPDVDLVKLKMFYTEETYEDFFAQNIDYVIDASDTIIYKIHLIVECKRRGIPVISSMGMANKMDPTRIKVIDIKDTTYDPIAKMVRTRLRKHKIYKGVPVVFSDESPIVTREDVNEVVGKKDAVIRKAKMPPSSNAFVPSVAGLVAAGYVINQMLDSAGVEINRIQKQ